MQANAEENSTMDSEDTSEHAGKHTTECAVATTMGRSYSTVIYQSEFYTRSLTLPYTSRTKIDKFFSKELFPFSLQA
jgi:hypothetical protein